jgi:acyl-lipid omega-6 desaturase (Delta-12 desaturase)
LAASQRLGSPEGWSKALSWLIGTVMEDEGMAVPAEDGRIWVQTLGRYRETSAARSAFELLVTAVPLVALWGVMWVALGIGYWLCLLLAVPTAGFLVRLFVIHHDCGHGAFFRQRSINNWVGRIIGVVTLTPYDFWRRKHAMHHAAVGNLKFRGMGDVKTLTVSEYLALGPVRRLGYRIFRHPAIMFGVVPAYLFLLHYRLPAGLMRAGVQPWCSTMGTNAAIGAVIVLMGRLVGMGPFLLVSGPVVLIAASLGVWLFYVQHQFEHTRWAQDEDWNFHEAALHGGSYYELPPVLAWFTGNIGIHHVHHLCSRIPFYRLAQVMEDHPELASVGRLTFVESFRCSTLVLWDETQKRLISFRELRMRRSDPPLHRVLADRRSSWF